MDFAGTDTQKVEMSNEAALKQVNMKLFGHITSLKCDFRIFFTYLNHRNSKRKNLNV